MHNKTLAELLFAVLAAGCSGPPFPADADGSDGQSQACLSSEWSCADVTGCADGCGTNTDCIATCKANGCETAGPLFDAVTGCAAAKCWSVCMSTGSECDACVTEKCADQITQCLAHTCPTPAECDPPGGDGTGPGGECQPSTLKSCLDIMMCSDSCGTDSACTEACKAGACDEASGLFDAITSCASSACIFECLLGSETECDQCVTTNCAPAIDACAAHVCPEDCGGQGTDPVDPPEPPATATATCADANLCAQACMSSLDSTCIDACKADACESAQASLSALLTCADDQCFFECFLFGQECTACQAENCSSEASACQTNAC